MGCTPWFRPPPPPAHGLFNQDPPCHYVAETPQNPPNARVHDPSLCAKNQYILHYGEVKNSPTPECMRPTATGSLTVWPRSSAPSWGWQWLTVSHRPFLWGDNPGIWTTPLSPVACHMPRTPSLHLTMPPPPPVSDFPVCASHSEGGGGVAEVDICTRKKMLQEGQRGWGRFPLSIITIVSWKWRCMKWICRLVHVVAHPSHLSTGHPTDLDAQEK